MMVCNAPGASLLDCLGMCFRFPIRKNKETQICMGVLASPLVQRHAGGDLGLGQDHRKFGSKGNLFLNDS